MDRWTQGFATQAEVFDWVATSHYFDSAKLARSDMLRGSRKRAKDTRTMFQNFLDWTLDRTMSTLDMEGKGRSIHHRKDVIDQALQAFGRKDLYERLNRVGDIKQKIKQTFSGKFVTEWTGVQGRPVRWIMDEVQRRLEPSQPTELGTLDEARTTASDAIDPNLLTAPSWQVVMSNMTVDQVREHAVRVKEELDQQGKLHYDFREAKKLKAERKALMGSQSQNA